LSVTLRAPGGRFTPDEIAAFRRDGWWADEVLSDLVDRNAAAQPDAIWCVDGRTTLTFGELKERSDAFAQLLSKLGVRAGERVMVQLPNWVEATIAYAGVARLGAVYVPRLMVYREHEMEDAAGRVEAVAYVTCGEFRRFDHLEMALSVQRRVPSVKSVIVVREEPRGGALAFEELTTAPAYEGPKPSADDVHLILFTSGTTAQAKGVIHTFNTYVPCSKVMKMLFELGADDVCFMPSPVMHNTGNQAGLLLPLLAGIKTVYQDVFEPTGALEMVSDHGCTYAVGATPFVVSMIDAHDPAKYDLNRFRLFGCGGAPVPGPVVERAVEVLGCKLMTIFGQSESQIQTATRMEDPVEVVASSDGREVPGTKVSIRDDDGNGVPRGEEGEICSKGAGIMLAYWRDPERTAEAFDAEGWFHSGDLGRMNEAGYVRVTGRKKDIVIRGGMNVSALEVEELLLRHPSVRDVAIVGMPDRRLGEKLCAYVVPAPGTQPTVGELAEFLRGLKVMNQKLPERVELRESLPRTPTGKVEKYRLRDEIAKLVGEG
jgi:cyclohexanecarboxylate-CoA ligase